MKAHRTLLAMASPIFEAILFPITFDSDGKTATPTIDQDDKPVEVSLPDEDPAIFHSLLTCIYSDKVEVNSDNFKALVSIADRYQVEKLNIICTDFLSNDITLENALEIFAMTSQLRTDSEVIREFIRENTEDIFQHDSFEKLSPENLKLIISDDFLGIDEFPLFEAVVRWGEAQVKATKNTSKDALKTVLSDVMNAIRFPLLTIQEIVGPVGKTGLLDQKTQLQLLSYAGITDDKARKALGVTFNTKPREGGSISKESKLLDRKYKKELLRLFENKKVILKLLYRASRDGFDTGTFHSKCDGKGPTFTVIKSGSYLSGGYNHESWHQSGSYASSGCWLYTLENPSHTTLKFLQSGSYGAYSSSGYGPTWGGGHDLHINSSMLSNSNYSSPSSFTTIAGGYSGSFSNSTLFGSYNFTVSDIEVFTVEYKKS